MFRKRCCFQSVLDLKGAKPAQRAAISWCGYELSTLHKQHSGRQAAPPNWAAPVRSPPHLPRSAAGADCHKCIPWWKSKTWKGDAALQFIRAKIGNGTKWLRISARIRLPRLLLGYQKNKQTKKNTTNQTKHTAALWMPVTDITKLGMSNTNMQCQSGKMANYLGEKFRSSEDKRGEGPLVFFRKFFILSITNAYAFS